MVKSLIDFERRWRDSIRPGDLHSPLILPECSFETKGVLRETWSRAHNLRKGGLEQIDRVVRIIELFRRQHYLKGRWIDEEKRTFDQRGPWHAIHVPDDRHWKFTFKVPEGFHYDVELERGGRFWLRDATGAVREFIEHTNVDCHGYVRGGK